MPSRPMHQCSKPGCHTLTNKRYCPEHTFLDRPVFQPVERPNANERGYDSRWNKARVGFLRKNPVCIRCGRLASLVDHKIPHKNDMTLFWDTDNWQPMCHKCHSSKTLKDYHSSKLIEG